MYNYLFLIRCTDTTQKIKTTTNYQVEAENKSGEKQRNGKRIEGKSSGRQAVSNEKG